MIVLPGDHPALENAAIWLRREFCIPTECTVFDVFEKYFNCRIVVDDRTDNWMMPTRVEFVNEKECILFLLKYS